MNEQLQKALVEIITKATTGMDTAISFLSAELPDVIHQLLVWKMVNSVINMCCWMILPIFFAVVFSKIKKYIEKNDENLGETDSEFLCAAKWGFYMGAWGFLPIVIAANKTWLQILIAPKLYLIEYAAQLIK